MRKEGQRKENISLTNMKTVVSGNSSENKMVVRITFVQRQYILFCCIVGMNEYPFSFAE